MLWSIFRLALEKQLDLFKAQDNDIPRCSERVRYLTPEIQDLTSTICVTRSLHD